MLKLSRREEDFDRFLDPTINMSCKELFDFFMDDFSHPEMEDPRNDIAVIRKFDLLLDRCYNIALEILNSAVENDDSDLFYIAMRGLKERGGVFTPDINTVIANVCLNGAYKCFEELLSIYSENPSFLYVMIGVYSNKCDFIRKAVLLLKEMGVTVNASVSDNVSSDWFSQVFFFKLLECFGDLSTVISIFENSEGISLPLKVFVMLAMEGNQIGDESKVPVDAFRSLLSYYDGSYEELHRVISNYLERQGRHDLVSVIEERM